MLLFGGVKKLCVWSGFKYFKKLVFVENFGYFVFLYFFLGKLRLIVGLNVIEVELIDFYYVKWILSFRKWNWFLGIVYRINLNKGFRIL